MAHQPSYETDDSAVPAAVRIFFKRRLSELTGIVLFLVLIAVGLSLASWSVDDPSLNHALDRAANNWLGYPGAVIADELMQFFGLGVLVLLALPVRWAVGFLSHDGMRRPLTRLFAWAGCALTASAALAALPVPSSWSLVSGLGGNAGDVLLNLLMMVLSLALSPFAARLVAGVVMSGLFLFLGLRALGLTRAQAVETTVAAPGYGRKIAGATAGAFKGLGHVGAALWSRWRELRRAEAQLEHEAGEDDIIRRLAPQHDGATRRSAGSGSGARIEPVFSPQPRRSAPPADDDQDAVSEDDEALVGEGYEEPDESLVEDEPETPAPRVSRSSKPLKPSKRLQKDLQPGFRFGAAEEYQMPPLTLLAEPKRLGKPAELSDEALEQNARMLEGVLDDFGVKGQILKVRPGPVVTLYELEPAPGIKSSPRHQPGG